MFRNWFGACAVLIFIAAPAQAEIKYQHIPAQKKVPQYAGVKTLDKKSVTNFTNDVHNIIKADRSSISADDLGLFFHRHIADGAEFSSGITYEMPGHPPQYNELTIDKTQYINGVLQGTGMMADYTQNLQIQTINIDRDKRGATVKILIHEKGKMPWPKETPNADGSVDMVSLPVRGISECEQKLKMDAQNNIQMQGAQCRTTLTFESSYSSELGADMFFSR